MASNQMLGGSAIGTIPTVLGSVGGGTGTTIGGSANQVVYKNSGNNATGTSYLTFNDTTAQLSLTPTYTQQDGSLLYNIAVATAGAVAANMSLGTAITATTYQTVNRIGGAWQNSSTAFYATLTPCNSWGFMSTTGIGARTSSYTNGGIIPAVFYVRLLAWKSNSGSQNTISMVIPTSLGNYTVACAMTAAASYQLLTTVTGPNSTVVASITRGGGGTDTNSSAILCKIIRTSTGFLVYTADFNSSSYTLLYDSTSTSMTITTDLLTFNAAGAGMSVYDMVGFNNFSVYSILQNTNLNVGGPVIFGNTVTLSGVGSSLVISNLASIASTTPAGFYRLLYNPTTGQVVYDTSLSP